MKTFTEESKAIFPVGAVKYILFSLDLKRGQSESFKPLAQTSVQFFAKEAAWHDKCGKRRRTKTCLETKFISKWV